MKNNLRRVLEVVSVLALFLSINAVNLSENTIIEKQYHAIELPTEANVGYTIFQIVDGNDVDNYVPDAALIGAGAGAIAGTAVASVGAGGTALAAAKFGAKVGAIGGGLLGAIVGASVGAL